MKGNRPLVIGLVAIVLSLLLGTARGVFNFASMVEPTPVSYVCFPFSGSCSYLGWRSSYGG